MSEQVRRKLKVAMQENAMLKAEVEELKRQPDPLTAYLYAAELGKDAIKKLKVELTDCKAESDRLKADVERLTWLQVETLDERNKAEAEVERLTISNALTLERLEAMKRLDTIRRLKSNQEPGPLTNAPD